MGGYLYEIYSLFTPWIPEGAPNYDEYGDVARSAKSTYEEEFSDSEGENYLELISSQVFRASLKLP